MVVVGKNNKNFNFKSFVIAWDQGCAKSKRNHSGNEFEVQNFVAHRFHLSSIFLSNRNTHGNKALQKASHRDKSCLSKQALWLGNSKVTF